MKKALRQGLNHGLKDSVGLQNGSAPAYQVCCRLAVSKVISASGTVQPCRETEALRLNHCAALQCG